MQETWIQSLDREDPLEKAMAPHSSTLALGADTFKKVNISPIPASWVGTPSGHKATPGFAVRGKVQT